MYCYLVGLRIDSLFLKQAIDGLSPYVDFLKRYETNFETQTSCDNNILFGGNERFTRKTSKKSKKISSLLLGFCFMLEDIINKLNRFTFD